MMSRKRRATVWETIEDKEGQWTIEKRSTAEVLVVKYFPTDEVNTDAPEKLNIQVGRDHLKSQEK